MNRALLLLVLILPLSGCKTLNRMMGKEPDQDAATAALPDDYTVTGVTTSDFQFIPVRAADSAVVVRVNRPRSPEAGWHDCDRFEISLSTKGVGGGGVRLGYLNLSVGGVAFPVAPAGTAYEIRSIRTSGGSTSLY